MLRDDDQQDSYTFLPRCPLCEGVAVVTTGTPQGHARGSVGGCGNLLLVQAGSVDGTNAVAHIARKRHATKRKGNTSGTGITEGILGMCVPGIAIVVFSISSAHAHLVSLAVAESASRAGSTGTVQAEDEGSMIVHERHTADFH